MFYLKRDRNLCVCVCVCVYPLLSPNSCLSHPAPHGARCFTSVMSFTFRHLVGLRCDFLRGRDSCHGVFYFKDCWNHHRHVALCSVARWHRCSCRPKFGAGGGCLGPSQLYSGYGSPRLIPRRMIYGMCRHEQRNAPLGGGNLVVTVLSFQSPSCHQECL